MPFIHKVFLSWLLYMVVVLFSIGVLVHLGLPQAAIMHDRSFLTVGLLVLYVLAEATSARQAWLISREHRSVLQLRQWLDQHHLAALYTGTGGTVLLCGNDGASYRLAASVVGRHLHALRTKLANSDPHALGNRAVRPGNGIDQRLLLETMASRLYGQVFLAQFIALRIVWVGIFATILGVILAFWPLLGANVDAIKPQLGGFFGNIAIAFIPTAASFVFKIALDVNDHILSNGVGEIVEMVAELGETRIIPLLEQHGRHGALADPMPGWPDQLGASAATEPQQTDAMATR